MSACSMSGKFHCGTQVLTVLLQPTSSCIAPAEAELAVIPRPRAAQVHGLATLQEYLLSERVPPKAGDLVMAAW